MNARFTLNQARHEYRTAQGPLYRAAARLRLLRAMREAERLVYRKDLPSLLRRQA